MKRTILFAILGILCSCAKYTAEVRIVSSDGEITVREVKLQSGIRYAEFRVPASELKGVDTLAVVPSFATAVVGEPGFFMTSDCLVSRFVEREKPMTRSVYDPNMIKMVGIDTPRGCFAGMMESYRFNANPTVEYRDGKYRFAVNYFLKHLDPEEDIILRFYRLKGAEATYSGMGRLYRKLYVEGKITPLAEKVARRPLLKYAVDYPEIRIRQCWKPVPTPTGPDQTRENEPEVRVKVTFDRCCDIVDALKAAGVPKAQLTLVGWNLKGHDGRFPTVFPPEEKLGGEKSLKHLIAYAQKNGYQIVPHICTGDSYKVSEDFDENDLAVMPDGRYDDRYVFGSGRMYKLCNKVSYEKFVRPVNDSLRAYGFRGVEYNDVYSIIPPVVCIHPDHPLNEKESTEYAKLILKDGAEKIGGIGSEGGYDHVIDALDFCLYTSTKLARIGTGMIDEYFPVWHIIYNGYIYSCPFSQSVNYSIKAPEIAMKIQEYGCHPTFYFYAAHRDDAANWIGNRQSDLFCETDQELEASAKAIREGYDYLQKYGYIQYQYMNDHSMIAENVYRSVFSDGTVVICNYSEKPFTYQGTEVAAENYAIIRL